MPATAGTRKCDCCNVALPAGPAYQLTTSEVVRSEAYWVSAFTSFKRINDGIQLSEQQELQWFSDFVHSMAGQSTAWGICEDCSELFVVDRHEARAHARDGTSPDGCGPVDTRGCVHWAAQAWEQVFGRWPASVTQWAVVDSCDQCRKKMYVNESYLVVPKAKMAHYRETGLVDHDPVRPLRLQDEQPGWRFCVSCMARLFARIDRHEVRGGA